MFDVLMLIFLPLISVCVFCCLCVKLKVTKCLADVGLSDERNILSKKLSGGQKRKLSLAMAIIGDPRVDIY